MDIEVLDTVVLTKAISAQGLRVGDVGVVVEKYGTKAIEAEFVTGAGRTLALVTLHIQDVRKFGASDLLCARPLDAA